MKKFRLVSVLYFLADSLLQVMTLVTYCHKQVYGRGKESIKHTIGIVHGSDKQKVSMLAKSKQ